MQPAFGGEPVRVQSDEVQGLGARLEQAPGALEVSALVVVIVLVLVYFHVNEPVVEGYHEVYASIVPLSPVKPHGGCALKSQARGLQEA